MSLQEKLKKITKMNKFWACGPNFHAFLTKKNYLNAKRKNSIIF